jgi:hypothetical protein
LTPAIFRHLQEVDWGAVGKELLAFAEWRARNYQWRSGWNSVLAAGQSLEDVVQHVIKKRLAVNATGIQPRGHLSHGLKIR